VIEKYGRTQANDPTTLAEDTKNIGSAFIAAITKLGQAHVELVGHRSQNISYEVDKAAPPDGAGDLTNFCHQNPCPA